MLPLILALSFAAPPTPSRPAGVSDELPAGAVVTVTEPSYLLTRSAAERILAEVAERDLLAVDLAECEARECGSVVEGASGVSPWTVVAITGGAAVVVGAVAFVAGFFLAGGGAP